MTSDDIESVYMDNPIGYESRSGKFYVWTQKWRIEYMKHFDSAADAAKFIASNPDKCVRLGTSSGNISHAQWIEGANVLAGERGAREPTAPSIGGILLLVALGIIVSPLINLYHCRQLLAMLGATSWEALQSQGNAAALSVIFEVFFQLFMLIASIALVFYFFGRKRAFPKLFIAYICINFSLGVLAAIIAWHVPNIPDRALGQSIIYPFTVLLLGMIWIPYFLNSKRVKRTFVTQ